MDFDCSVTDRKGCNYCLAGKQVPETMGRWNIYSDTKELQETDDNSLLESIKINYCPICGRKL